jgi:hypothetical protein
MRYSKDRAAARFFRWGGPLNRSSYHQYFGRARPLAIQSEDRSHLVNVGDSRVQGCERPLRSATPSRARWWCRSTASACTGSTHISIAAIR